MTGSLFGEDFELPASAPQEVRDQIERLQRLQEQTEAFLASFESARDEAGDLSTEAESDDGLVRAKIDEDDAVLSVDITDAGMRRLDRLGRSILSAINNARTAQAEKTVELVGKLDFPGFDFAARLNEALPEDTREALRRQREQNRKY